MTGRVLRASDSESILFFFQNLASKGFNSRYNYFWTCAGIYEISVLIHLLEARKNCQPFEIILSKKLLNNFFNDLIKSAWLS
jgi:hypothetical protein